MISASGKCDYLKNLTSKSLKSRFNEKTKEKLSSNFMPDKNILPRNIFYLTSHQQYYHYLYKNPLTQKQILK